MVSFLQTSYFVFGLLFIKIFNIENKVLKKDTVYRLPQAISPTFYNLYLEVIPEENNYTGTVEIIFDVVNEDSIENNIYLHVDAEFVAIEIMVLNSERICNFAVPNEAKIIKVTCPTPITGIDNKLFIAFTSKFSTVDAYGLSKATYVDSGNGEIIIGSNFKPTYARRAFPCMDEPNFKANFSMEVKYPKEYSILSNSPAIHEELDLTNTSKTTTFGVTSKISPHLVSVLISKLKTVATEHFDEEYDFKMFTRTDIANCSSTVRTYHSQILDKLTDFIGVPYGNISNAECYHVAVPNSLDDVGNFGVFSYREIDILDEGDKTTGTILQNIVKSVTNKLCHQWYGGDIATKWWSDVWANEAVAAYLQYVISDEVLQEFDIMNQFVVEVVQRTMQEDALPTAQPLSSNEAEVFLDWDVERKLEGSSNMKGASVLHMINYILKGEDGFKASLQYHWSQRTHLDSNGDILLTDLAVHLDPTDIPTDLYSYYHEWGFAPGFPQLNVKIKEATDDYAKDYLELSQKRFVYPLENMTYDEDTVWTIPISMTSEKNKNFDTYITVMYTPNVVVDFIYEPNYWVIFNTQVRFLYRVNYEESLWKLLIKSLKNETERIDFHVLNRAQLVDDIFNIARTGDVSYALAFDLVDFLENETDYYPWYSAFNAFSYLIDHVEDDGLKEKLEIYILELMANIRDNVTTIIAGTDMSRIDVLKKNMILNWECKLGGSDCIDYTTNQFKIYKENRTSFDDYDLRDVILCNGVRYSDDPLEDWDFLWSIYTTTLSVHEQNDILKAFGCIENQNLLEWYLLKTITPNSGIKKQDIWLIFKSVLSSSLGLKAIMEFLNYDFENMASYYNRFDILSEVLYLVAEKLVTDEHVSWLKNILNNQILDEYEDIRTKALTLTSINNYWIKRHQEDIKAIFSDIY